MGGIYLGTSLVAAFLAGSVALFAPCCIVFMFPAYLAAAVRNRRWRLLPLTFVFAAGLAVVLVPVTLGVTVLTQGLLRAHPAIYGVGGALLVVLAALAATGTTWALPFLRGAPDLARTDSAGVFALGVFSGAASSCCAPVLAGVVALSAVAPGPVAGVGLGLAYVFGMVFPLVVITAFWDGTRLADKAFRGREVSWRLGPRRFTSNTVNLLAAAMFGIMGIWLLLVAATGASLTSSTQAALGRRLEGLLAPVVAWLRPVPDWAGGLILVALAVAAMAISGRRRHPAPQTSEGTQGACHGQHEHQT